MGHAMRHSVTPISALTLSALLLMSAGSTAEPYYHWLQTEDRIDHTLGGLTGDATRGRALVADGHKGNCLACHVLPIPEEAFHGSVGPSLVGIGAHLNAGQLRLRIVDQQRLNPNTIMPPFYRPFVQLHQVAWEFEGKTFLSAQEVEDIVAYLKSLTMAGSL